MLKVQGFVREVGGTERFKGFFGLLLDFGVRVLEVFQELLKEVRKQRTLAIIALEIKVCYGHGLN
jgi:hypothetical protein